MSPPIRNAVAGVGVSLARHSKSKGAQVMSILMFIFFGLIVGFLARAIMPGRQSMGLIGTALIGIAGSFVGGMLGNLFYGGPLLNLHTSGFIGSILGALLVLAVLGVTGRRRRALV
jgi:uncharacterized membrane protein YeaQ/YmgE (transglycosylase-associated protein family)